MAFLVAVMLLCGAAHARTLVAYYSFTNNCATIANELKGLIPADVVVVEPAEKGLDYAADNYAIGSAQIAAINNAPYDAASYPAIDAADADLSACDCVIIIVPLWWNHMAAPMQSFLFNNADAMAGKRVGLVVSSASSGIGTVEADARRLMPQCEFFPESLWIRSSQTSRAASMLSEWLKDIDYDAIAAADLVFAPESNDGMSTAAYDIYGRRIPASACSNGVFVVNGKKYLK